jgi:hypothetical protein
MIPAGKRCGWFVDISARQASAPALPRNPSAPVTGSDNRDALPGVTMPTMRSPGTTAIRRELDKQIRLMPRTGIADGLRGIGRRFQLQFDHKAFLGRTATRSSL